MKYIAFVFEQWEIEDAWSSVVRDDMSEPWSPEYLKKPARIFDSADEAVNYAKSVSAARGGNTTMLVEVVDLDTLILVVQYTLVGGVIQTD